MKGRRVEWKLWGLFVLAIPVVLSACSSPREIVQQASTCEQADCVAKNRGCMQSGGVATCTDCNADFVNVGGSCVAALQCEELQCEARGRRCEQATNNADDSCTDCMSGFVEKNGECVAGS